MVFPALRTANMEGALMAYSSFLANGSCLQLRYVRSASLQRNENGYHSGDLHFLLATLLALGQSFVLSDSHVYVCLVLIYA
jgi:hypothetical protein